MALPSGPNQGGGLPPRPGIPQRPGAGTPPKLPNPQNPSGGSELTGQGAANAALRDALLDNSRPTAADVNQNDRLGQYDFDGQRAPRTEFSQTSLGDIIDSEPEREQVSPEDQLRLDEARIRRERETAERFERSMDKKEPSGRVKKNVLKAQEGELDRKGQNVFVDKKTKKLEPFGGKKSAMKQSDVDSRKNIRQSARAIQVIVILLFVAILGFSIKNAFFPPASLTQSDVQQIVYQTSGTSAFPLERGQLFAQAFMNAYMDYNPKGGPSTAVLQYFTVGKLVSQDLSYPALTTSKNYLQKVVYGPITYQSQSAGNSSALYTVGALVEISNTGEIVQPTPQETTAPTTPEPGAETPSVEPELNPDGTPKTPTTQTPATPAVTVPVVPTAPTTTATGNKLVWMFFAVNVYYDAKSDSFAIAGWPTIVPTPSSINSNQVPADIPPGTGTTVPGEVLSAIKPTIYGFLEAYRVSSATDNSKLMPYLPDSPTPDLLKGLNSEYVFKSGAADDQSVNIAAYTTDIPTQWKATITVTWTQTVGDAKAEFMSTYIMTIERVSSGYDVTRFIPTVYTPKE